MALFRCISDEGDTMTMLVMTMLVMTMAVVLVMVIVVVMMMAIVTVAIAKLVVAIATSPCVFVKVWCKLLVTMAMQLRWCVQGKACLVHLESVFHSSACSRQSR